MDRGFLHVRGFLSEEARRTLCARIDAEADAFLPTRSLTGLGPRYSVIDGDAMRSRLPELIALSAERIVPLLERETGARIEPLASSRRAARVQVYDQRGDGFRWHRDGHELAAVLTLACDNDGYTELLTPRASRVLKHVLYPLYATPFVMSLAPSTKVLSRAGDLLLLRGRDTIHRGAPATRPGRRVVVVYAYDRQGARRRPLQDAVARFLNY